VGDERNARDQEERQHLLRAPDAEPDGTGADDEDGEERAPHRRDALSRPIRLDEQAEQEHRHDGGDAHHVQPVDAKPGAAVGGPAQHERRDRELRADKTEESSYSVDGTPAAYEISIEADAY
jgi:hypothetical protein